MGRPMFTIIVTTAELVSSPISERVTANMRVHGRSPRQIPGTADIPQRVVGEIKSFTASAGSTAMIGARGIAPSMWNLPR